MDIKIERATVSDAEEILTLQKLAYTSEAEIYSNYTIEPLIQPLEEVQEQFKDHVFLKAIVDETIVGSVRGRLEEGTFHIGKLIVHPDYQNKGIGKQLMSEIESYFNMPLRYELFTGNKSERNLQLYEKIGYKIFKTKIIDANLSSDMLSRVRRMQTDEFELLSSCVGVEAVTAAMKRPVVASFALICVIFRIQKSSFLLKGRILFDFSYLFFDFTNSVKLLYDISYRFD